MKAENRGHWKSVMGDGPELLLSSWCHHLHTHPFYPNQLNNCHQPYRSQEIILWRYKVRRSGPWNQNPEENEAKVPHRAVRVPSFLPSPSSRIPSSRWEIRVSLLVGERPKEERAEFKILLVYQHSCAYQCFFFLIYKHVFVYFLWLVVGTTFTTKVFKELSIKHTF